MPELPEVEMVVRGLRGLLLGRTVQGVWTDWPKVMATPGPEEFAARIQGQTIRAIHRRAKYILCQLDHDILAVHLRMTGRLYVIAADEENEADRWVHFRLELDNGQQLRFSDARRFGRVYLLDSVDTLDEELGPEPLDDEFTLAMWRERLVKRKRAIKPLLLDQGFLAGVGNIYADEALHRAGIHPLHPAHLLTEEQVARLYEAIRETLSAGIEYEGASVNWYRKPDGTRGESQNHFRVYGREGEPCTTCGHPIEKMRVGQRGTHYCPHCQPAPVIQEAKK